MLCKTSDIRRILLLAVVLVLSACKAVTSDQPLGLEPLHLDAQWEGTWLHDEGAVSLRVVDADSGRFEVAWIEREGNGFRMERYAGVVKQFEGWLFGSVAIVDGEADDDPPRFLWGRIKRDGRRLLLWTPQVEAIAGLVEAKTLPGHMVGDDVHLRGLMPQHLKRLQSDDEGTLFAWDEPLVLTRLE